MNEREKTDSIVWAAAPYPWVCPQGRCHEAPSILCLVEENDLRITVCHFQESEFLHVSVFVCFLTSSFRKTFLTFPISWELSSEYWTYWKTTKSRGLSGVQLNCRGDTAQILQRNSKVRKPRRPAFHCSRYFLSKALQWFFFPSYLELKTLFLIFLFKSLKFLYFKYLKIKYKPLSLPLL